MNYFFFATTSYALHSSISMLPNCRGGSEGADVFLVAVSMLTPYMYAWHSSIPMLSSSRGGSEGADVFFVAVPMLTPYAWHSSIPMLSSGRGGGEGADVLSSLCELCIAVLRVR